MKKIKLLLLLSIIGIILPLGVDAASKKNVYIFKGSTCGFCKKALTFFQDLVNDKDYADKFDLVEYEVWHNEENAKLGQAVATELGEEMDGVPYIVIGDQTFSGYTTSYDDQIKAAIDTYYNDDSATSVVEKVRDGGEYEVTPEYTLVKNDSASSNNADTIIAIVIIIIAVGGFGYVIYLSRKDNTSKYYEKPVKKENKEKVEEDKKVKEPVKKNNSKKSSSKTSNKKRK